MNEYIPSLLRNTIFKEDGETKYGIGIKTDEGFGMLHGPFNYEMDCLEIPGEPGQKIIEFDGEVVNIIWRWRNDKWVSKEQRFPKPLRTSTKTGLMEIDNFPYDENDDLPF